MKRTLSNVKESKDPEEKKVEAEIAVKRARFRLKSRLENSNRPLTRSPEIESSFKSERGVSQK